MSELKHPGTITFFDKETGEEWSKPVTDFPERMHFVGGVPVVHVEMWASGNITSLMEFGPNREVLRTGTGFRTPPPEPPEPKHPGTITYIDEEAGTQFSKQAEDVPIESRFQGDIPVVKVVFTAGEKMLIQAYGPNGELLRTREGAR